MRLLVAEDDPASRHALESRLRHWGREVVSVPDGEQAWERLRAADAPHTAILGWMMPGLDGVEVCRRARRLRRDIRPYLIVLSGGEAKKDLVLAMDAGADDYITKPFEPEELRARVHAGERIINLQAETLAAHAALQYQATHDSLTDLLNRGAIMENLVEEFRRSERSGEPVGIVIFDLDHFKAVNDSYSHAVGDTVLIETARRVTGTMRPYERVGRFGGEEFLVVLSGCDWPGAGRMAERLRAVLADREFHVEGMSIPVTASFGAAASSQLGVATPERLVKLADAALYRAKRRGRNCVELALDLVETHQAALLPAESRSV